MVCKDCNYIFELEMKVRDYEVDSEGIVNNAIYLHYFEHTRHEFCEWAGLSFGAMHSRGIDPVVRRVEVDYLLPLRLGERMVSRLALERRGARFVFIQDIYRRGRREDGAEEVEELAAHGVVTIVAVEDGRLSRGEMLSEVFARFL